MKTSFECTIKYIAMLHPMSVEPRCRLIGDRCVQVCDVGFTGPPPSEHEHTM